jgi:hypothetical protein
MREAFLIPLLPGSKQLALLTTQALFASHQICMSSSPTSASDHPAVSGSCPSISAQPLESTLSPPVRMSRTTSCFPPEKSYSNKLSL